MSEGINILSEKERKVFILELAKKKSTLISSFRTSISRDREIMNEAMKVIKHSQHNKQYNPKKNWTDVEKLWNIVGYIASLDHDIKISSSILANLDEEDERSIIACTLIIAVYEGRKDLSDLIGVNLKELLEGLSMDKTLFSQMAVESKELGKFDKEYGSKLKEYRDNVAAHRGWKNFLQYTQDIDNLDWVKILQISMQFSGILYKIGPVLNNIAKTVTEEFIKTT